MSLTTLVLILLGISNLFAFAITAKDKHTSTTGHHTDRIPEGFLFFLASAFGAIGVYAAMILFRHKTRKWYFQIGIPLLILQNLATLYLLTQYSF